MLGLTGRSAVAILPGPFTGPVPVDSGALLTASDGLGFDLLSTGDIDGDGVDDFLSATEASGNGAYLVLAGNGPSGAAANALIAAPVFTLDDEVNAPCPLGDIDGDGTADLGATAFDWSSSPGAAIALYGPDLAYRQRTEVLVNWPNGCGGGDLDGDDLPDMVVLQYNRTWLFSGTLWRE